MAELDPYTGPWTRREASHLLRRACFGASLADIDKVVADGRAASLDAIFTPLPAPADPIDPLTGQPYTTGQLDLSRGFQYYNRITKAWWLSLMYGTTRSIHEKLTLFWSNHFATEMTVVQQPQQSLLLLKYLRANAFGNFKDMARQVTIEPAMLRYLNGNVNTKGSPNENYARELQELFTIGKGKEVAPGDYTTFTEQDVQAAARVLTGWRDSRLGTSVQFVDRQHDTTDKVFSQRYGNTVIKGRTGQTAGNAELTDLINMIFDQSSTSKHVLRRLYRWFVYHEITEDVERTVIEPLADQLRSGGWNIGPVLKTLLSSEHFFSANMVGSQIKSPADFLVGTLKAITTFTPPTDTTQKNQFFDALSITMAAMQMDLNDPPSVAGWEAYYQQPDYDRIWLTTATLPLRNGATDSILVNSRGLGRPILDTVAFTQTFANPEDPYALVDEMNIRFFAVAFPDATRERLVLEVLLGGSGLAYDWTTEWQAFLSNPSNTQARQRVKLKLDTLYRYMFRMAEFHIG